MKLNVRVRFLAACLVGLITPSMLLAKERVPLYIYTSTDLEAINKVGEQFEKEHPTIDVIYREYSSHGLFEELAKLSKAAWERATELTIASPRPDPLPSSA